MQWAFLLLIALSLSLLSGTSAAVIVHQSLAVGGSLLRASLVVYTA